MTLQYNVHKHEQRMTTKFMYFRCQLIVADTEKTGCEIGQHKGSLQSNLIMEN